MRSFLVGLALTALAAAGGVLARSAAACELCSPPPPEFATVQAELEAAATVVLADLAGRDMNGRPLFVVRDVLRGGETLIAGQSVAVDHAVSGDGVYLLFGNLGSFEARRPRRVDEDVAAFATLVARAPAALEAEPSVWGERLALMVPYLSDRNTLISTSASAEFAAAPYEAVHAASKRVKPGLLLAALTDRGTEPRSRGALALLLALSGDAEHGAALQPLLRDEQYRASAGYDAIVAAYLMLRGREALDEIRGILRARLEVGDARTGLNVLAALRFHAQRTKVLPREAILAEVRALLADDALAPAAILELATLEDWQSLPAVMDAFRRLRPKGPMILGPAARFLTECPLPEAEAARTEVMGRRPPGSDAD